MRAQFSARPRDESLHIWPTVKHDVVPHALLTVEMAGLAEREAYPAQVITGCKPPKKWP
jgi:hypothetical protein